MSCCLCSEIAAGRSAAVWNQPVIESENFVVLPSLGALVPGWLLIAPKVHYICTGSLPDKLRREFDGLKADVWSLLSSRYGSVCAFEHGPAGVQRSVGCGVDHAHMHLVPVHFDLIEAARPHVPVDTSWSSADWRERQSAYERHLDYLYVEQPLGVARIAVHSRFGSQVFRKAIADRVGIPAQYNWREFPRFPTVLTTLEALRSSAVGVHR
jgi:ATP adenylyltransferase